MAHAIPSTPTLAVSTAQAADPDALLDAYLEQRITTVITRLVRSGSVPSSDREDWAQDLRLAILESRAGFDPVQASWHTYANGVIHRTVRHKVREMTAACRDRRSCVGLDQATTTAGDPFDVPDRRPEEAEQRAELAEAMQVALAEVSADARAVAGALMEHGPAAAITALGWPRSRFYRAKDEITRALRRADLG